MCCSYRATAVSGSHDRYNWQHICPVRLRHTDARCQRTKVDSCEQGTATNPCQRVICQTTSHSMRESACGGVSGRQYCCEPFVLSTCWENASVCFQFLSLIICLITHAGSSWAMDRVIVASVILCVCPCISPSMCPYSESKKASAVSTKFGKHCSHLGNVDR